MPWMPRIADLIERINQCVLAVRLECKVKVDGGACRRVIEDLPVFRDGIPCVFQPHVVPKW